MEDLPIDSMRNPPLALKEFSDNTKNEDVRITMPTYVGSNTPYLSFPFLQFNLRGQGNYRKMFLSPSILEYKETLLINKPYTTNITMKKEKNTEIKNLSEGQAVLYKKKIWVESVSDQTFEVIIDTKKFDESTSSEDDIDITVTIQSTTTGVKTAYLRVDIEDGVPLSYFIQAEFQGPLVSIVESCVEFGLQKINSQVSFTMNIQNHSPVEAPIIIKNANDFHGFTYEAYLTALEGENTKAKDEQEKNKSVIGVSKKKKKKNLKLIKTKGGNRINFTQQHIVIPPNSRGEITVNLNCTHEEVISEILEVLVKDADSQFIYLNANIQKIKICLSRYNMDLGLIYAGIKQIIDSRHSQSVIMKNYGNIPAKFDWNEVVIPDKLKIQFDPPRGTIAPHSEFVVNI